MAFKVLIKDFRTNYKFQSSKETMQLFFLPIINLYISDIKASLSMLRL